MSASEYTTTGVSVTVNNEHFERILPSAVQRFWRDPYFFCGWGVLQSLSIVEEQWTVDFEKHKPLWFLFDPRQKAKQFAAEIFYAVKSQSKQPNTFGNMVFGEMAAVGLLASNHLKTRNHRNLAAAHFAGSTVASVDVFCVYRGRKAGCVEL